MNELRHCNYQPQMYVQMKIYINVELGTSKSNELIQNNRSDVRILTATPVEQNFHQICVTISYEY